MSLCLYLFRRGHKGQFVPLPVVERPHESICTLPVLERCHESVPLPVSESNCEFVPFLMQRSPMNQFVPLSILERLHVSVCALAC